MLHHRASRREWGPAAAAAAAWLTAWTAELAAYAALKAHLLRRGRWSLPADTPLARTIVHHCRHL
jgi:hypothetical protein